nr:MAG TPA: hypothetical protein [Caudoviricetes sp.]
MSAFLACGRARPAACADFIYYISFAAISQAVFAVSPGECREARGAGGVM